MLLYIPFKRADKQRFKAKTPVIFAPEEEKCPSHGLKWAQTNLTPYSRQSLQLHFCSSISLVLSRIHAVISCIWLLPFESTTSLRGSLPNINQCTLYADKSGRNYVFRHDQTFITRDYLKVSFWLARISMKMNVQHRLQQMVSDVGVRASEVYGTDIKHTFSQLSR